jgi:hypothetical protein
MMMMATGRIPVCRALKGPVVAIAMTMMMVRVRRRRRAVRKGPGMGREHRMGR